MNDTGIVASCLLSLLSKITNPENNSQFKLVKDSKSHRVNELLIHKTIPGTLYNNFLTFRDIGKDFELKGDLLKLITSKKYNVDFASLSDRNYLRDFAKEMHFDVKAPGNKNNRDGAPIKFFISQGLMNSASVISKTIFLPSDPDVLCNRLKPLLQEKQNGIICNITNERNNAIIDNLSEYKCKSKKQHKLIFINLL